MRHALWLGILGICATARVGATESKPAPLPPHEQQQSQAQNQSASSAQTQTANGGAGGTSSAQSSANGTVTSSNRSVALVNGAPNVPVCPAGLVPGRGRWRGHSSPLYSISPTCNAPDAEQAAAIAAHREHEARLATIAADAMRAEAERDRAATERIRAQACGACK